MSTPITPVGTSPVKRHCFLVGLLLIVISGRIFAQETAAGGQAATSTPPPASPVPTNPPSGLLTPPPDNAPTMPAPAATNPAPPPAPVKMTSGELARIQQQEIIRRQYLVYQADEALKAGRKAEVGLDYPIARKNYLFAAEALGSITRSTSTYAAAAEGLTRVDLQLYDDALKRGDTPRAKKLIDEVIKYNPNNKIANERLVLINRALANPNDTTLLGNTAVTPGFVNKVNEVQQLLAEAEQFRRTGQWDEAEARLKRILGMDPYNIAATRELEKIDAQKYASDEAGRVETRDQRLTQVEEKWYEPINNKDVTTTAEEAEPSLLRTTNFGLEEKLKDIFLSLDFSNATIDEATSFLSIESQRLDPDHKGVNFVIEPTVAASAKPVSITLNNVPLGEALRYVCQLANVKYKVQDYAISIVPFSQNTDDLISRTFVVQPNFVVPPATAGVIASGTDILNGTRPIAAPTPVPGATPTTDDTGGDTVRQALIAKGVKFPPGASAVYTPNTGQLTVVDTADQMELLEELVNAGQAPTLMVRIATKFLEINQNDLNDFTVNTAFNFFSAITGLPFNPSTSNLLTGTSYSSALPGALGLTPDGIDELINPQPTTSNSLFFRGMLSGEQYNIVITALSQKTSTDLLSEPAVLTKSGEQGVLEAVRVFPYPISFDPPELVTQTTNSTGSGTTTVLVAENPPTAIPTTPTDFKRRNVGVRLVVKPQVTADNKTVDLSLFPEVTDFEGFINYGNPLFVANPDGSQSLLTRNVIEQPVFNTRRINTKVLIRDGSTVVLGGLIREDLQTLNDKVPILGDIPLIGRLFQSKAVTNTKRNLIIFVTANIYRNDGELLNPPEVTNAADILTGRAGYTPVATP